MIMKKCIYAIPTKIFLIYYIGPVTKYLNNFLPYNIAFLHLKPKSEREVHYYHQKPNLRITSHLAERFKI